MREDIPHLLRAIHAQVVRIADAMAAAPHAAIDAKQAYSRQQAARLLGVSVWLIDQARSSGELAEAQRIGSRQVRITGESMVKFQQGRAGIRKVMRL